MSKHVVAPLKDLPPGSRKLVTIEGRPIAVEETHRSHGLGALHAVSVWASEWGLSLGQVACAEKSNEITAIPELLRLVDIKGGIVTIDAMGTQKAIAEQIIAGGADYVLALKGNQETLHQSVIDSIDEQLRAVGLALYGYPGSHGLELYIEPDPLAWVGE